MLLKRGKSHRYLRLIHVLFLVVCVFSLFGVYSVSHVTWSAFSDTEQFTATVLLGSGACVHGQGFWRHHLEEWPVMNLTVGDVFYTKEEAVMVMNTPGGGDKTYDVFRQLVATVLNLDCGCNPECIEEDVGVADAWLVEHPVGSDVRAKDPAWKEIQSVYGLLGDYNEGLLCTVSCNSPPDPPRMLPVDSMSPQLVVFVADVDYDVLTVRFYDAEGHQLLGECDEVESDSNVSIALEQGMAGESFGWYVVVSDPHAEVRSATWWCSDAAEPVEDETGGTSDVVDQSAVTAVANTTYTFQVLVGKRSGDREFMVVYWYTGENQTSLLLESYEDGWEASIPVASHVTVFWYRLYVASEPGLWEPVHEREVMVMNAGEDG